MRHDATGCLERGQPPRHGTAQPVAGRPRSGIAPDGRDAAGARPPTAATVPDRTGAIPPAASGGPGGGDALLTPYHRGEIERLALRHGVPAAQVESLYTAKLEALSRQATVSAYLPLLVEKHVRDVIASSQRSRGFRPRP